VPFIIAGAMTGCDRNDDKQDKTLIANGDPEKRRNTSNETKKTWYQTVNWVADDFFEDRVVVDLCKAIERDDTAKVEQLISDGVDVNALGKGRMTPLLWALPDGKLVQFERLIDAGADPNVIVTSDFHSRGIIHAGHSVTHLAAGARDFGFLRKVIDSGCDPNIRDTYTEDSVLHTVIQSPVDDKIQRVKLLIENGADLDAMSSVDATPVILAVRFGRQYDVALLLLDAGANPFIYGRRWNKKLIHAVVEQEQLHGQFTENARRDYDLIVSKLVDAGESVERARSDLERWSMWLRSYEPSKVAKLRKAEREKLISEGKMNR